MAPALSSNSFLLNTAPSSRLSSLRNTRLTVFAKRAGPFPPFRLGKPADDSSAEESVTDDKQSSNPFSFNFGKVSDVKSLIPVVANPSAGLSFGSPRRKDPGTVFVAGATGQAGIRIAQTLLREGFTVRAGVADLGAAQELARLAAQYKIISKEESKRLNAVESTFQDAESIAKAIGNASKVVVTIGPAENGPTSEVTTSDAAQVIQAAQLAGVGHVAIVYDGTSTSTSTYNVLDGISLFFNNLFSRSQPLTVPEFLQKVVEAGVSYTLIKTRLTEDFSPESSYNVVVSAEGSVDANDYKVARSQIASLVANVFANTALAENKVVKVFTDPAAPLKPVDELFSAIPEDGRRKAYAESIAKAEAEEEARKATAKAVEAAKVAKRIEADIKKLEEQEAQAASLAEEAQEKAAAAGASVEGLLDKAKEIGSGLSWEKFSSQLATAVQNTTEKPKVAASLAEEAQEKAAAAGASVEGLLDKAKEIGSGLSWEKFNSQLATAVQNTTEKPKVQIATVRGQAKAQTLLAKKAVIKTPTPKRKQKEPPKPKQTQTESKPETRKLFGGLFQQETIYVDD